MLAEGKEAKAEVGAAGAVHGMREIASRMKQRTGGCRSHGDMIKGERSVSGREEGGGAAGLGSPESERLNAVESEWSNGRRRLWCRAL